MTMKQMANLQIRRGTLKENVDQIRFERNLARKDNWRYGGCGYANSQDESILLNYIAELEKKLKAYDPAAPRREDGGEV